MSKKAHTYMTPAELDRIRIEMGCKWVDREILLQVKRRTLQGYASGKRGIPKEFADKVRAAARHDKKSTRRAINKALRQIDRDHPAGIRSEIEEE